jgi:hypothetical protein
MANTLKYNLPTVDDLSEGLKFWKLTKKDNAIAVNIFFDSSSLIDMLLGVGSLYRSQMFNESSYNNPCNLVYALAYRNWLGTIFLLPPHTEELIDNISNNNRLFPRSNNQDANKQQIEEMWIKLLNTADLSTLNRILRESHKQMNQSFIDEIQQHPYHPFLGVYFAQHDSNWRKRYVHLVKREQIVQFSEDSDYPIADILKSDLYHILLQSLDKDRSSRTANNSIDAYALCILNEKLNKFSLSNTDSLPLFFCNQDPILKAVNSIPSDYLYAGRRPFHYVDPLTDEAFSIIRNSGFFIIDGFFNAMQKNKDEKAWQEFYDALHSIIKQKQDIGIDAKLEKVKDRIEPEVHGKVMLEFFDRWWNNKGIDEILDTFNLQEDSNPGQLAEQVASHVEEERTRLAKSIQGFGSRYSIIKKAWHVLRRFRADVEEEFINKKLKINAFDDFGSRVDYSDEVCEIIQDWVDRVMNAVELKDEVERKTIESEVINDLISVMFEKIDHYGYDADKLNRLAASIGFFFCFKKYDLVAQVCTEVRKRHVQIFPDLKDDKYPSHSIALIHAASLFQGDKVSPAKAEAEALEIIECVETKNETNYRAWIGLAYLYILLWKYRMMNGYKFRELMSLADYQSMIQSKGVQYHHKAINYSKSVIDFLTPERLNQDPQKYSRKYYYALNIYIFLSTFYTNYENFNKLKVFVEKLEGVSAIDGIYQESRYSDTLARYYFRLALVSRNEEKYNLYLDRAKLFNEKARMSEPKPLYFDLKHQIEDWEHVKGGFQATEGLCQRYENLPS